ncbi:hypothetical protein P5673_007540 [Acropora cervicornis]|uniref:Uncharacterized protein n=1 Tax=Acropora cervicornis TaxID=6130 RepID=A0AAD9VBK1_ACRCE|nr:hypothetical protein P5673_007540 [Acropora cervicornis]
MHGVISPDATSYRGSQQIKLNFQFTIHIYTDIVLIYIFGRVNTGKQLLIADAKPVFHTKSIISAQQWPVEEEAPFRNHE